MGMWLADDGEDDFTKEMMSGHYGQVLEKKRMKIEEGMVVKIQIR